MAMHTNSHDPIVITSVARTAIGAFQGQFSTLSAPELAAFAIRAALERAAMQGSDVGEALIGCVLPAGIGQAPARQAALRAGLPLSVAATTISKVCGSGMKAVMLGSDLLCSGSADVVVTGGMESMTNAPYLLPKARGGYRLGHSEIVDHMFLDGLEDRYDEATRGRLMGTFAEDCAAHYGFSREEQDAFATTSTLRAQQATVEGRFGWEITPVDVTDRTGVHSVSDDEGPRLARIDKISTLRPAFAKTGTVTAANSSSISDGAAALVLTRLSLAEQRGWQPLAYVRSHATHAQEPKWFTTAPVGAVHKLMARLGWSLGEVDLWEINEAFAVVPLAAMRELHIPHERVNVNGGACSLGHPIGASGARILVTLLAALRHHGMKRGVATLCIGGGEATAIGIEMF